MPARNVTVTVNLNIRPTFHQRGGQVFVQRNAEVTVSRGGKVVARRNDDGRGGDGGEGGDDLFVNSLRLKPRKPAGGAMVFTR